MSCKYKNINEWKKIFYSLEKESIGELRFGVFEVSAKKKALQKLLPKPKLIQVFHKQDSIMIPHFNKLNIDKICIDTPLQSKFQYL